MSHKKIKLYYSIAEVVAKSSTCPRAQVGAVLVNDDRVISIGYNGSARGTSHCNDVGCILRNVGDKISCFRATHAEVNAVVNAAYGGAQTKGAVLVCTHKPCNHCLKVLVNAGIVHIYYVLDYPDSITDELLKDSINLKLSAIPTP